MTHIIIIIIIKINNFEITRNKLEINKFEITRNKLEGSWP